MTDFIPLEAPANDVSDLPVMNPGRPIGRDSAIREIYSHLQSKQPVLLTGEAGIGKTATAAALSAAFAQQPGGVLWLNHNTDDFASILAQVGRALRVTEVQAATDPTAHVGAVTTAITKTKPLMVFDNVRVADGVRTFVERCVEGQAVLILSEGALAGPWETVSVGPLSDTDAAMLFKQKSGLQDNSADIDVYAIAKFVRFKPFPLVMSARGMVASKQAPGAYQGTLRQAAQTLGEDPTTIVITLTYRALNNALQGLVLMLGATFRGEASAEFLSAVSNVPTEGLKQPMNVLTQLYLVQKFTRYDAPYFRLHPLVYEFAQNALRGQNQISNLQQKVHDATLQYARTYSDEANYPMLAKEMHNLVAAAQWAVDERDDSGTAETLAEILEEAGDFVREAGYNYELGLLRQLAGEEEEFAASGVDSFDFSLPDVDDADDDFSFDVPSLVDEDEEEDADDFDFSPPSFDAAEDEEEDADDFDFSPPSFGADEDEEEDADDFDFSPPSFDAAEDEYDEEEDEEDEVGGFNFNVPPPQEGDTHPDSPFKGIPPYQPQGRRAAPTINEGATDLASLQVQLQQARASGDKAREAQLLKSIGKALTGEERNTEAISTYNELLEIYDEQDDDEGTLDTLNILSALLTKTGNTQAAVMHAMRGLQMAESDDVTRLHLLTTLGDARQELGETQEAVNSFQQALELSRETGDAQNEAISLYKLGYAHLDNGSTDDAIHALEQARALFKAQDKRAYEGRVLGALGSAYAELDQWSEAIGYHRSALHIAREVGDQREEMLQLSNLGQAQLEVGRLPEALLSHRQALHLAYLSGDRDEIVSTIIDTVRLMMRSNRLYDLCELLLRDAQMLEPEDRDVRELQDEVTASRDAAEARGVRQAPIAGTAQEYAANAYALLDQ